jgi:membrane protein DedA with SNARE-associated domain
MVEHFIEEFTYLGIFIVLFGAGVGVPVPEELPIVASGALAHEQIVRWWLVLPLCWLGVLSGDVVLYTVGRYWGEKILDWRVVRRVLRRERETYLLNAYRRHGVKIVFVARHVMGLRAAAFLTAGIARLPFWKFITVDGGSALLSVPVGFGIGFIFTDQLEQVMRDVHRVEAWLVLYALLALAVWLAWLAWRQGRRA